MMYQSKLAVALKSAGKVLREFKDTVYVPFGSEYSVFIKNMNSVRALVKVTVDGVDVGDGTKFVVNANDSIDIERFIKNGNLAEGNRFKFIERTDQIEDHRGIGIEDGLVRVEFNFEKPLNLDLPIIPSDPWKKTYPSPDPWKPYEPWIRYNTMIGNSSDGSDHIKGVLRGASEPQAMYSASVGSSQPIASNAVNTTTVSNVEASVEANDAGITVPGSVSDQEFKTASWFPTETETHVIVLKILGQTEDNTPVRKPVTVKAKPKCTTCGRVNKATAKFCTECGTSLNIV